MIRPIFLASAVALAAFAAGLGDARAQQDEPAAPSPDLVVAIVDGESVRYGEVELLYGELPQQYHQLPIALLYDQLVDLVIDRKLMAAAARAEGMDEDPAVEQALAFAADGVLESRYISKLITERLTDENLHGAYDEMVAAFVPEEEVRARHILLKTEDEARDVIAELEGGADFAELAARKSIDPTAKTNQGDLDWFAHDQMMPALADAAFALEEGEFSREPLKSDFGWHVVKAEGRRQTEPPSYEASLSELRAQEAQAAIIDASAALRTGLKIERFGPDGQPLPLPEEQ